ncbi:30S ribosomal protein S19 [Methanomicrobium antiquum]|uniref:Small ribosomal subunit protein uS19 n=1 Tax=Methanomicrobium antiquum TaxID=487686 RepID=A0AAF0FWP3_9EURY|nr:30S ribosomal protein S19 [Methanomicrobium antiquum]MDD3977020.1 30S ribosomal protein S19 [Methanomicrobium sp.]WFN37370.1 30S ribosomal protein S19 [Methanomicrobium antiquum]
MAKKQQKRLPRRKEEFTYHGYKIEELQQMSLSELLPIMPSRTRRKFDRGLTEGHEKLLAEFREGKERIRTHERDMIILPEMVGKSVEIHNGKDFLKVEIQPEAVFMFLGEFALTRKRVSHGSAGIGATRSSKFVPLK